MDKINKIFNFEIKQVGAEDDRVLRFVGSDETPDRDKDIIEVTGWKLDDYLKNPVFLWAHDYYSPPIGKAVNVTIDAVAKKLIFDVKFPTADEYPFADTIYKLYKGGYLSATSVGFRGIKSKTRDEDEVLSLPEWQRGRRYMEQTLLELSAVPVPCNPNALIEVRGKGFAGEDIDKVFTEEEAEKKTLKVTDEVDCIEIPMGDDEVKVFSIELLKTLDIEGYTEEKSGATLSRKNKEMLEEICEGMNGCGGRLRKFIDAAGAVPGEEEDPPPDKNIAQQALEIKTQVLSLFSEADMKVMAQELYKLMNAKDAPGVEIDLDAIEAPESAKTADDIELDIEPDALKNMIAEVITQELKKEEV